MTCEDCLYKGFCENQYGDTDYFDDETICDDVESLCSKFKDKTMFVELPAALGSLVYCIAHPCAGCYEIISSELRYALIPEVGKTAFLTKEAAEKRLEELRNG